MGSTIETALIFTVVLLVLSILITGPEDICLESLDDCRNGIQEVGFMLQDERISSVVKIGDVKVCDCSPERFCTYISGLSDCYRIVYGSISDSGEEG